MRARWIVAVLVILWLTSRAALSWATLHDDEGIYRGKTPAASDLALYDYWADQADAGSRPYEDFDLEYPPANLPMLLLPQTISSALDVGYEGSFVAVSVALDALTLAGLFVLSRHRAPLGPACWVVGVPLLGPVALSRLDMVPAAALVWCLIALAHRRWSASGFILGVATGTKVFAGLLAPALLLNMVGRRRSLAFAASFVLALAIPFAFFVDIPGQIYDDVWQYHSGRGIAAESSWGSLLLAGEVLAGTNGVVELRFGAWEVIDTSASLLKPVATLAVLAVAGYSSVLAWRLRSQDNGELLPLLLAGTVLLSVGVGNVFSAQYVVWCLAAVAIAVAASSHARIPAALVVAAAALTHLVYPIWFIEALFVQEPVAVATLVARNALVIVSGVLLWRPVLLATTDRPSDPAVEQDEHVPTIL